MSKNTSSHGITNSGQVLLVMTGFVCNNNCLMCSVKPKGLTNLPRSTEEILANIEAGRQQKFTRIEFTGGEPTVRKDLLDLIKKAKESGYREIAMSTNCRTLSQLSFLKTLKEAGLNRVTTTIYGYNPQTHEAVTRVKGSFNQTVQGIRNCLSLGITLSANTVVFNQTAPHLLKIGSLLASLGVNYWTLLDLIPDGYALETYNLLSVPPQNLKKYLTQITPLLSQFKLIHFMDFPYCIFPTNFFHSSSCHFTNAKGRTEIIKQVGYTPQRFKEKSDVFYDIHKLRSKKCRLCIYNKECGGSWIPYFYLYNDHFIKPFLPKNNKQ